MRGAIDFRVVGVPPIKVFEWVKVNQQKYVIGGLGYYGSGGHIHADTRPISFVQKHGKRVASLVTWGLYKRRARGPIYAKKKYHHRVAHAT
jgi:hypothetical protein